MRLKGTDGDGTSDSMVSLKVTQKISRPRLSTSAVLWYLALSKKITDDIDIVHHLGRYQETSTRPRTTIIRFTNRSTRDFLWMMSKKSEYLKINKLRFAEDLTADDKAIRNKLWPMIEAAKKEGKKAHFSGTRVIIDGSKARPEQIDRPKWSHHTLVQLPTLKIPCDFLQDDKLKVY